MKNQITTTLILIVLTFNSCTPEVVNDKKEVETSEKPVMAKTGINYIETLFENLNSGKLKINATTKEELSSLFEIEANDYYMSKKIELEDHTLYITFTIFNGTLSKISYATLSNAKKDFSYILDITKNQFGPDFSQVYNTQDSTDENSIFSWVNPEQNVQYESFSGLNSGYELIIK